MRYFYLHGFASGINSAKAKFFKKSFAEIGIDLECLDLNGDDFANFLLSKTINNVYDIFSQYDEITVIGSSMGGLIGLNLAEVIPNIKKIILLAPALAFSSVWDRLVGNENLIKWKQNGTLPIYNLGLEKEVNLNYKFYLDIQTIKDRNFTIQYSDVLVFHGINDETIPVSASRDFCEYNNLPLFELMSDHSLTDVLPEIWQKILPFIKP